jgi:hypothetical protein
MRTKAKAKRAVASEESIERLLTDEQKARVHRFFDKLDNLLTELRAVADEIVARQAAKK